MPIVEKLAALVTVGSIGQQGGAGWVWVGKFQRLEAKLEFTGDPAIPFVEFQPHGDVLEPGRTGQPAATSPWD
jgi:hypothetical protein